MIKLKIIRHLPGVAILLLFAVTAQAQLRGKDPATIKDLATRCEALNLLDLQNVGDAPGQVVTTSMVIGKKPTDREKLFFKKRGHSQGNPTPMLEEFPDHCRVEGYVTNHIQFYIALPPPEKWNGRFMLAACDAWCGKLHTEITVPGLHDGYATLTNNGGHYSRAPFDGIWAHQDIEARINFGHRSNHVTAQVGKAIVEAYYGKKPSRSYLAGFSKGGNAGLFAAQKYPQDFDGIFVKAPVVHYNITNAAHFTWQALAVHPDGKTPVMYSDKIPLLHAAVTEACDEIDGLKDGVIDNPHNCPFNPDVLLCKNGQSEADNECLNQAQVTALHKLYTPHADDNGDVYFPYPKDFGSEFDWARSILPEPGSDEIPFVLVGAETGLRYMVLKDNPGPSYDWTEFDVPANLEKLKEMSPILDPDSLDMKAFRDRGGKMIIVHGWSDAMISADMTIDWFNEVSDYMGGRKQVGEFMQLYIVPGMVHGSGGSGPYEFDAQGALVDWVEKGKAPDRLLMTDEPGTVPFRTRPTFPYPDYAKYKGKGDPNKAENFTRIKQE